MRIVFSVKGGAPPGRGEVNGSSSFAMLMVALGIGMGSVALITYLAIAGGLV